MQLLPPFVGVPEVNRVFNCDAFELLRALPDKSVDAYITDLPYGTTACSWDEIIPFAPMWAEVKRTLKPRGVFVTTASQPFTSKLVMSNLDWFRYEWVWNKLISGNFLLAKYQPMKIHENVVVFAESQTNYYPQMRKGFMRTKGGGKSNLWSMSKTSTTNDDYYPVTIIERSNADRDVDHPTQKPVALYDYLIRTYTQPGDLVVDFCCGSGTTAIAARNLGRRWIAGDITPEYVDIARKRLAMPFTPNMFTDVA